MANTEAAETVKDTSPDSRRKIALRGITMALGAIFLWAPWAAWANYDYGFDVAYKAALTQASLSFFITLFMTLSMEAIAARNYSPWRQWSYSILGPCGAVSCCLVAVHLWVGTPNWLLTITPSVLVGLVYTSAYSFWRSEKPSA